MIDDPTPKVLTSGISFGEQPRWHEPRLWFSDRGGFNLAAGEQFAPGSYRTARHRTAGPARSRTAVALGTAC